MGIPMPSGALSGILQPKRVSTFRVLFGIEESHAERLTAQVKSVTKPRYVAAFGEEFGFFGETPYNYVSLEVYDDVMNYASQAVNKLLENKFTLIIEMLDGSAFVLERITIHDCLVQEIDYSSLDYATGAPCMINLTVKGLEKVQEFSARISNNIP